MSDLKKSDNHEAGVKFVTSMITDWTGWDDILLPINPGFVTFFEINFQEFSRTFQGL